MGTVFDQMNQQQQVRRGPENDYQQALSMLGNSSTRSPNWENYQGSGDNGKTSKGIADVARGLLGYDQSPGSGGNQTSISPEAGQQQVPYQGQESPQAAMAMVAGRPAHMPQWSDYGGGGGGGGGMDMGSMASMAMSFV